MPSSLGMSTGELYGLNIKDGPYWAHCQTRNKINKACEARRCFDLIVG
jgi:hypothetical protein